ncbi:connectin-like [Sarcoptes scabiei]|nr:connectin-like [Sarcoptes scabiei]
MRKKRNKILSKTNSKKSMIIKKTSDSESLVRMNRKRLIHSSSPMFINSRQFFQSEYRSIRSRYDGNQSIGFNRLILKHFTKRLDHHRNSARLNSIKTSNSKLNSNSIMYDLLRMLIIVSNLILSIASLSSSLPSSSSSSSSSSILLNNKNIIPAEHLIDHIGPYFLREPPQQVIFSNKTGTVIFCSANGNPMPKISWETKNGQTITDVTGLRYVRHDNALVFQPFTTKDYRPDLHSNAYRCVAENAIGIIKSRYCHVRAVVEQRFVIEVYDEFVPSGSTAILRCHIPAFMRDLLDIVAWLEGSTNYILPDDSHHYSERSDLHKYHLLPSGELLINKIDSNDALKNFRCQVKHRITQEKILSSNSGRVFVSEMISNQPPRIIETNRVIVTEEGYNAEIVCLAQGYPEPQYLWYKDSDLLTDRLSDTTTTTINGNSLLSNYLIPRIRILSNSILIEKVNINDAGIYRCIVNNSLGSELSETQLIVRSPLIVQIGLPIIRVELGHSLTLNCTVSGGPIKAIEWLHNGRSISSSFNSQSVPIGSNSVVSAKNSAIGSDGNYRIRLISREVLHITKVTRADKGMYQCVAYNEVDSAQAQVQLKLGDNAPQLLSVFTEQTLQPGQSMTLKRWFRRHLVVIIVIVVIVFVFEHPLQ